MFALLFRNAHLNTFKGILYMTQQQLDDILNNSEFSDCIADAAPYRVKIIKDISPQMKEIQDEYVKLMIEADWKGVSRILDLLKKDKKDADAKGEYSLWRKQIMNLFRATLKTIHPNENQVPSIGMLYVAGSLLTYIDRKDLIDSNPNVDKGSPLAFKKFEDLNSYFKDPDVKARMVQLFIDADDVQGQMCEAADEIKKTIYEQLPTNVKFDKDLNKNGIKPNQFCALVRHKAMGLIKDKEKYTKYISNQIDNTNIVIGREEIVLGKTKQM
jgi:hypothetical protein